MALTEDLQRIMGFDQGPDNNAEVNIKIKPLGAVNAAATSEPSTVGAAGGATGGTAGVGEAPTVEGTPLGSPLTPTGAKPPTPPGTYQGFGPEGQSIVPLGQRQKKVNPTLVTHPLGARTDDLYESAIAQLQFDANRKYLETLADLGWMDEAGNFIPGLLETEAVRRRSDLGFERDAAIRMALEGSQRGGTVFSGRRAWNQAQAQRPYDAALANLETTLGRELGLRYGQLGDITRQFELGRQQLIAEAAQRFAAQQQGGPAGPAGPSGPSDGGDGGPSDLPPAEPTAPANPMNIPTEGPFADFAGVTTDDWLRLLQQRGGMRGAVPY